MARIGDEAAASRLARAVVADILLYHEAAVRAARAGGDVLGTLEAAIAEGRELFRSRVEPVHHPIFERVAAEMLAVEGPSAGSVAPPADAAARRPGVAPASFCPPNIGCVPHPSPFGAARPGEVSESSELRWLGWLALVALCVAITVWLWLRG